MTPEIEHVLDQVRGVWRFRWLGNCRRIYRRGVWGWLVVFALPDRYQAEARVFVDTRTALKPRIAVGLTVDQNVDAQINFVRQSLLEGPELEHIAKATGVLPASVTDERKKASIPLQFQQEGHFAGGDRRHAHSKSAALPAASMNSITQTPAGRERWPWLTFSSTASSS